MEVTEGEKVMREVKSERDETLRSGLMKDGSGMWRIEWVSM